MTSTFRSEARALVELAIPLIGVNLGISAMGLVDTAMIGRTDAASSAEAGTIEIVVAFMLGTSFLVLMTG